MKKINYYLALCLLFFISVGANAGNTRVIGYFPSYRATTDISAQCALLTDVIFSFINPNTDGTLITNNPGDALYGFDANKYTIVRDAASNNGANLWIAIGGADPSELRAARLSSVCNNSTYRNTLATALVAFATASTTSCYGISVDWEFPKDNTARAGHLAFVQLLKQKIAASSNPNIKIALAVGGETKNMINHTQYLDASFYSTNASLVDEWHIMAYDFPSGNGYDATNHSTTADAQASLEGWNAKGVPYSKMVLGVPFYGRTSNRSTEGKYNDWPNNNTVYTSDSYGGYYYNGINTLEDKIDLSVNKATMGVLIWDLGQDWAPSNSYSLLKGMDTYLATLCNIPKPNLGPDQGVCAPNSVTLNPGVATAVGRTFAWYKDNALQNGQTGTTFSASAAGTYKVVISQGVGCSKEDEIVIVAGAPFTTTGANGCSGTNLTLSVNNPVVGKTYDWYDASTGGNKVTSGTSYSKTFSASTTYYVEEKAAGVNTYTTTPVDASVTTPTNTYWWLTQNAAQRIVVSSDLTIKTLRLMVNTQTGATFKIKVSNSSTNAFVMEAGPFTVAANAGAQSWEQTYYEATVNFLLPVGSYFVYPELTSGKIAHLPSYTNENTQAGVYTLKKGMYRNYSNLYTFQESEETDNTSYVHYGPFLKWVIETGANASCGRTPVTASVVTCGPPTVSITAPTANQDFPFDGAAITLTATVTDETAVTSVSFEIWDGASNIATLTPSANGSTYSSTWTATTWALTKQYTLKVIGNDATASTTQSVNFTVSSGVGVTEVTSEASVNVYPNPSTDNVNVNIEVVKGGSASIEVYDLAGRLTYSNNSTLVAGKNTSSISVNSLNAGTYLMKVTVDGQTINKAFSVVK
ncbi:MAG: glycosyl hydrolase family 18 protein [Flavobacteriales bacterium]